MISSAAEAVGEEVGSGYVSTDEKRMEGKHGDRQDEFFIKLNEFSGVETSLRRFCGGSHFERIRTDFRSAPASQGARPTKRTQIMEHIEKITYI